MQHFQLCVEEWTKQLGGSRGCVFVWGLPGIEGAAHTSLEKTGVCGRANGATVWQLSAFQLELVPRGDIQPLVQVSG